MKVLNAAFWKFNTLLLVGEGGATTDVFNWAMDIVSKGCVVGGSLLSLWGVVHLGTNLKDLSGPDLSRSIMQIVGGVIVGAAGIALKSVHF